MSKLELWEYLHENQVWHSSTELRERFNIKQQMTLRKWTAYPFIISYGSNQKFYKFNDDAIDEYRKVIEQEIHVPPIKLKNGKEVQAGIPEPDNFTIVYPFPKSQLKAEAETFLKHLTHSGAAWNPVKETILLIDSMKLNSDGTGKIAANGIVQTLAFIIGYNGMNLEGLEELKKSLAPPVGDNIEDIRKAELDDIMKHVPKKSDDDIDYESFFNSTT